ncbi:MAG: hypothetical protein HYS21_01850 [Deltaproteobacteria bacterium]|nr:hypothetical protein [Deltaproteobacteria bacterium]
MSLKEDYNKIIDNALDSLEYLIYAGLNEVPKGKAAAAQKPSVAHEDTQDYGAAKGYGLTVWLSTEVAFACPQGLSTEEIEQVGKIISWVKKEFGAEFEKDYIPLTAEEVKAFEITRTIKGVSPKIIVAFGPEPSLAIIGLSDMASIRGRIHNAGDIRVMPTHEPIALIQRPELKRETMVDITLIMKELKK